MAFHFLTMGDGWGNYDIINFVMHVEVKLSSETQAKMNGVLLLFLEVSQNPPGNVSWLGSPQSH